MSVKEAVDKQGQGSKKAKDMRMKSGGLHSDVQNVKDNWSAGSTAMQDAMENDLILECILENLCTKSLIRGCRLVNKQWNRAATKILKKRPGAAVKVNGKTDLAALEVCVESSADFPMSEIELQCSGDDFKNSPEEWLQVGLFRRFSSLFTRLRLTISDVPDITVTGLLSDAFNHIVSLTVNSIKLRKESRQRSNDLLVKGGQPLILEKLKFVAMGKGGGCHHIDQTFLAGLLQCCPNLQCIEGFTNAHLSAISTAGKLSAVKSLRVCWCIDEEDAKYPMPSGVTKITTCPGNHYSNDNDDIDDDDIIIIDNTTDNEVSLNGFLPFLKANHETLERIEVYTAVHGESRSSDWPKLSKVTSLLLMAPFDFPDSVDAIFPVLDTIQIGADSPQDFGLEPLVDGHLWKEPLSSVTKLEVFAMLRKEDWVCLYRAVPNVRHIFVDYDKWGICHDDDSSCFSFEEKFGSVVPWEIVSCFKQMETLYISPRDVMNWDRFFTGIPISCVEILRENPQLQVPSPEFIDLVLRKGGSVADLSGLKELVVRFKFPDIITRKKRITVKSISHVALKYGFSQAPVGLRIIFLYDHWDKYADVFKCVFKPVSERVSVGHWNANLWHPRLYDPFW